MKKTDAADKIAAGEYPYPAYWTTHEEDVYNHARRNPLAIKIRKAIGDAVCAERTRCEKLIMEYHRQQLREPPRHQAFVCDDLATLIMKQPAKKARGKK